MIYKNRDHAGDVLAKSLEKYKGRKDLLILGLPRGGVPVAFRAASRLKAPLDIFMVRKVGAPGQEELAIGAVASNEVTILNKEIINSLQLPQKIVDEKVNTERLTLLEQEKRLRGDLTPAVIKDRPVILIDDGLATGASMKAAVIGVQSLKASRVVVAVPVCAHASLQDLESTADEVICVEAPGLFRGVGQWYEDFSQVEDETVKFLLKQKRE